MTADEYPYLNKESGKCNFRDDYSKPRVRINEHYEIPPGDIDQLKAALVLGPVGVSVAADAEVFRHYSGGIIDASSCGTDIGHAVLAVGYGTDSIKGDYVYIKNSWG